MSEKRIFETDDKFWEVWIDGSQVFTHFGKTGAAGQTKIKPTADASAAEATLEDMVAKKKKEGFKQTGGPKPPAGPALDAKELKKLLAPLTSAQDPAVMVLADWLQGQNHPWGELIALQYAAATTPKKAAALEKAAAPVARRIVKAGRKAARRAAPHARKALSNAQVAARRAQGRYMSAVRMLSKQARVQIKAIRKQSGVAAAIKAAKKLTA